VTLAPANQKAGSFAPSNGKPVIERLLLSNKKNRQMLGNYVESCRWMRELTSVKMSDKKTSVFFDWSLSRLHYCQPMDNKLEETY
jgi:hypothetical protein